MPPRPNHSLLTPPPSAQQGPGRNSRHTAPLTHQARVEHTGWARNMPPATTHTAAFPQKHRKEHTWWARNLTASSSHMALTNTRDGYRVHQEPGSTPSTTHTTAYLQSNAWSTHGVQEHDRASGGAATHGCGHHCGFVCGTCCGNDCVHFCRFVGWSCCGTCRDHFGKQANSPANVPQRTPHPVRLELLLFA